jgi:hypothetical protein
MWELLSAYDTQLRLGRAALDPAKVGRQANLDVEAGVIESTVALHTFAFTGVATVGAVPGQPPKVDVQVGGEWRKRR